MFLISLFICVFAFTIVYILFAFITCLLRYRFLVLILFCFLVYLSYIYNARFYMVGDIIYFVVCFLTNFFLGQFSSFVEYYGSRYVRWIFAERCITQSACSAWSGWSGRLTTSSSCPPRTRWTCACGRRTLLPNSEWSVGYIYCSSFWIYVYQYGNTASEYKINTCFIASMFMTLFGR